MFFIFHSACNFLFCTANNSLIKHAFLTSQTVSDDTLFCFSFIISLRNDCHLIIAWLCTGLRDRNLRANMSLCTSYIEVTRPAGAWLFSKLGRNNFLPTKKVKMSTKSKVWGKWPLQMRLYHNNYSEMCDEQGFLKDFVKFWRRGWGPSWTWETGMSWLPVQHDSGDFEGNSCLIQWSIFHISLQIILMNICLFSKVIYCYVFM